MSWSTLGPNTVCYPLQYKSVDSGQRRVVEKVHLRLNRERFLRVIQTQIELRTATTTTYTGSGNQKPLSSVRLVRECHQFGSYTDLKQITSGPRSLSDLREIAVIHRFSFRFGPTCSRKVHRDLRKERAFYLLRNRIQISKSGRVEWVKRWTFALDGVV